ncbi:lisH domain-containing protein ARMC9 isoform X2 [Salarias fasciatus]|uniref:lisH domain-containing protein ARMC9 isoform X2 n=1 Tax=Salarias fasciatus TaxID=181472 RepID=UPI0011769522|nr:lisH domain-containing protein ARMC9 isoform X2 [Salarias fasciatus]
MSSAEEVRMGDACSADEDLLAMIIEYLSFAGYDSVVTTFNEERKCKAVIKQEKPLHGVMTSLIDCFDNGDQDAFFKVWTEHIPVGIVERDVNALSLEFYLHIHFTIVPLRWKAVKKNDADFSERISSLKKYFKTRGAALSQTAEFLPYYALPYVSDPTVHPLFKALFEESWLAQLKEKLERFLTLVIKPNTPRLLTLYKDGGRSTRENIQKLQLKLHEAEKRTNYYADKFKNLQTEHCKLIMITAELVKSLEATVAGKMVSPDYLQSLYDELRNSQQKHSVTSTGIQMSIKPHLSMEVPMLPSLNYGKLKADIVGSDERRACLLLQALCWRLTHSLPGDQRESVLQAYIRNDLLEGFSDKSKTVVGLLDSSDEMVLEYMVRLINAFASFAAGRGYLAQIPSLLKLLMDILKKEKNSSIREKTLMAIQKLSLRRSQQTPMIEDDLISWLVNELQDSDCLSDNTLEYSTALLLNLSLRTKGRRKCAEDAKHVLKVLIDLLGHENHQIRSFVNGTLYSIFCVPSVREEAKEMSFEAILQCYTKEGNPNFSRQIGFIIKLLNSDKEEDPESDDEEGDDNNEDLLEMEHSEDEILQPQSGELTGETLLTTDYLGIMTNVAQIKINTPILEPFQRPVTPKTAARSDISLLGSPPGTSDSFHQSPDSACGQITQESGLCTPYEDLLMKTGAKEMSTGQVMSPESVFAFMSRPKLPRTPQDHLYSSSAGPSPTLQSAPAADAPKK